MTYYFSLNGLVIWKMRMYKFNKNVENFVVSTIWVYAFTAAIAVGFYLGIIVLSISDSVSPKVSFNIENWYYVISIFSGLATIGVLICTIIVFKKSNLDRTIDIELSAIKSDNEEIKDILNKSKLKRYDYDNICVILDGLENDYKNITKYSKELKMRYLKKIHNTLDAYFSNINLIDLVDIDSRRTYKSCIDSIINHLENIDLDSEEYSFFVNLRKNRKADIHFDQIKSISLLQIFSFITSYPVSLSNNIEEVEGNLRREISSKSPEKNASYRYAFPELHALAAITVCYQAIVNEKDEIRIEPAGKRMMAATDVD